MSHRKQRKGYKNFLKRKAGTNAGKGRNAEQAAGYGKEERKGKGGSHIKFIKILLQKRQLDNKI